LNILITGATGFIGRALINDLLTHTPHHLSAMVRPSSNPLPAVVRSIEIDSLDATSDYCEHLANIDVVIHLAARVHSLNENSATSHVEHHELNTESTLNLARQAAATGTSRFIYLSSIKVNGDTTKPGQPFTADGPLNPSDSYARSKFAAEQRLRALSAATSMTHVIIRPPLVYGPDVKANFQRLIKIVCKQLPMPLGSVENYRSLVSIENLTDLIRHCIDHPRAANETFLVSDDRDVSTPELLHMIAKALGKPCRLFPFPRSLLNLAATLSGKRDIATRLLGNLQVDISKTKSLLGWHTVSSLEDSLRTTAISYLRQMQ
jgi:nucleoside-diphosphate-sugar epimerase